MIELQLRDLIIYRYDTVKDFAKKINIPYTTIVSILNRGVLSASVKNIITICEALNLSVDELAEGRLVPVDDSGNKVSLEEQIIYIKNASDKDALTVNGRLLDSNEKIFLYGALDACIAYLNKK